MKTVAIVGWRGMVGSVLMRRLAEENDFKNFEPLFCSTSQVGQDGPEIGGKRHTRSCERPAGRVTGSTRPRPCAWSRTRSSCSTR